MKNEYKTKARSFINKYFEENPDNRFTAKEIYDWLGKKVEGVNRTTVYRNLERMSEQGFLMKMKEPNSDSWFYQYSKGHTHCGKHMHAQCSKCGKVFHLEDKFVDEFEKLIDSEYGFFTEPGSTVIMGKCKDCRAK